VYQPAAHTIHWSPSFGGLPDLPAILHAASAAGFSDIGLDLATVEHYLGRGGSLAELRLILADTGLIVTDVVALVVRQAQDPRKLGSQLAVVVEATSAPWCVAAVAEPMGHAAVVDALRAGLDALTASGARLAVEFGGYMGLRTLSEAIAVCADLGWERAGVLVDTYQCARAGTTIAELAALEPGHVALFQVADATGPAPRPEALLDESRHRRLVPGRGDLPLGDMLAAVAATGYRGPLVAEVLSDELRGQPTDIALEQLRRALASLASTAVGP
jgi:sugar phosphate isomerase/epimerase